LNKLVTKKKIMLPVTAVMLLALGVAGCSNDDEADNNDDNNDNTPTLSGTINEAGSTTVQPLAEKLAAAFKVLYPNVNVVIGGGGSSVGVKSATDGTVEIGAVSRELKDTETGLTKYLLAKDGIAIVVHPDNTAVANLTVDQVRDIFSGVITNWSQVGGPDKAIHVMAREEGSGTRTAFEELVMGEGVRIVANAVLQNSNGALKTALAGDKDAIGFISFGYIDSSVKALSINGIAATSENGKNGTYPIIRPLYFLTKGTPSELVQAFLDYCMSDAVQQIITEEGYLSVN
jgi:phosphate binding protein